MSMTAEQKKAKEIEESKTPQFQDGVRAYLANKPVESCPHPHQSGFSNERYLWMQGWYSEHLWQKHHIGVG